MTVREVAKLIGTSPQTIRLGLQQKVFDFGVAVKTSSRWTYIINEEKLRKEYKQY